MAYYALYKWYKPWCKIQRTNWVKWYKIFTYNEWFNSLSEEDKQKEKNRIAAEEKRKERELDEFFIALGRAMNMLGNKGTYMDWR